MKVKGNTYCLPHKGGIECSCLLTMSTPLGYSKNVLLNVDSEIIDYSLLFLLIPCLYHQYMRTSLYHCYKE